MLNNLTVRYFIFLFSLGSIGISSGFLFKPDKVIQIDVSSILDSRSVTTFTKGKLITWTTGIDKENGYLTMSAATFIGDKNPNALPDSLFPANQSHPDILLI